MELLEKVVKIEEQTLAEDHPDRLASQQNLAAYYWKLGDHATAFNIMTRVVEVRKQALHESHPDRQCSEAWLREFERKMAGGGAG